MAKAPKFYNSHFTQSLRNVRTSLIMENVYRYVTTMTVLHMGEHNAIFCKYSSWVTIISNERER